MVRRKLAWAGFVAWLTWLLVRISYLVDFEEKSQQHGRAGADIDRPRRVAAMCKARDADAVVLSLAAETRSFHARGAGPSEWRDGGAKSGQSARRKRRSGPERRANRPVLEDAVPPD
jgi:hypothetical protein